MYVDDEEALVLLMSRSLERLGYECTAFTNADTALQAFRTNPHGFAAVVTDLQMSTLSGLELVRAMREVRPELPVAVASGYGAEEAAGVPVRWIQKPATLVDLSHALSDMLRPAPSSPGVR
jgi:DNA-binding NtrC family response regulator